MDFLFHIAVFYNKRHRTNKNLILLCLIGYYVTESQSGWGWKAALEIIQSNQPAQNAVSYSKLLSIMPSWSSIISKDVGSTENLTWFDHSHNTRDFFLCLSRISRISVVPITTCPVIGHHWEESQSFLLAPIKYLYTLIGYPLSFLFLKMNNPGFLSLFLYERCSLSHLHGPWQDSHRYVHVWYWEA